MTGTTNQKARQPAVAPAVTALSISGGIARQPFELADMLSRTVPVDGTIDLILVEGVEIEPSLVLWLNTGEGAAAVVNRAGRFEIRWKPGRAVIRGPANLHEPLLAAVLAVDATDRKFRQIDREIAPIETAAPADVDFAYSVSVAGRSRWKRFDQSMKTLYGLRLQLIKCDPHGSVEPGNPTTRRAAKMLAARCQLEDRAERLGDRLEVLEDLYEGAVDRIVDHRWYVIGITIEALIVLLLAAETLLLIFRPAR